MKALKRMVAFVLTAVLLVSFAPVQTQAASVSKISVDYIYTDAVDIKVETEGSGTLQSFEYKVRSGGKIVKTGTSKVLQNQSGGSDRFCRAVIPKNTAVQVSVRAKKGGSWTAWSSYIWVVPKVEEAKLTSYTNKTFKISWTKMKGATDYAICVATSPKGKWKTVKTTKGRSITIRTYDGKNAFKTGKWYYVRVLARRKSGSGYVRSKGYKTGWYMFRVKFSKH